MSLIKFIAWNVQELIHQQKKTSNNSFQNLKESSMSLLQEKHLVNSNFDQLKSDWVNQVLLCII